MERATYFQRMLQNRVEGKSALVGSGECDRRGFMLKLKAISQNLHDGDQRRTPIDSRTSFNI